MTKLLRLFAKTTTVGIWLALDAVYFIGIPAGIWAAFAFKTNLLVFHVVASVILPFYGAIYWLICITGVS